MKKMLEISRCGRCNHFLPMLCICSATKGATLSQNEPPSWCPLPDAGWQNVATAPLGEQVLIKFQNGHIEDATFYDDGDGKYYVLYDGDSLQYEPIVWRRIPE